MFGMPKSPASSAPGWEKAASKASCCKAYPGATFCSATATTWETVLLGNAIPSVSSFSIDLILNAKKSPVTP